MFCRNCQTIIPDDSIFCENCGAPTGLDPEKIEESNLVPEEAVEFEIIEETEEPGDVIVGETEVPEPEIEVIPEEPQEEPEAPAEEPVEETFDAQEPADEPAEEYIEPEGEFAEEEPVDEPAEEPTDEEAEEFDWSAPVDQEEEFDWNTPEEPEDEPGEEPEPLRTSSVPVDPVWWEPPGEWDLPGDFGADEADAETAAGEGIPDETVELTEEEAAAVKAEIADAGEFAEEEEKGIHIDVEDLKKMAVNAAIQAKPYAEKAKVLMGKFGQNVKVGTEKAAVVAKEQFQQTREVAKEQFQQTKEVAKEQFQKTKEAAKEQLEQQKEAHEERKEQREQHRAEEKRQKDIAQRRKENDRIKEAERKLEFERSIEEDIVQQQGYWYGDEMPEPNVVIEPAVKAAGKGADDSKTSTPADTGAPAAGASIPGALTPEQAEHAASIEVTIADGTADKEAELPPEEEIEDKLADTAQFGWSQDDLQKAAEKEEAEQFAAEAEAAIEAAREAKAASEDTDEPILYRIKDFGTSTKPGKRPIIQKPSKPLLDPGTKKKTLIILAIVICIALAVIGITAAVIHQSHERQMAEEAYHATLMNAHLLADHDKYTDAEEMYLELIRQRPDDVLPYLGLAQMYMEQQRYVDAKALIGRATEATGDEESFAQMQKDIKTLTSNKWKKIYIKVLQEHEAEIRRYEQDVQASVAVCDVNSDKRPELFFFTKEYYGYGKLHIFTIVKKKAKEVEYECVNHGTQYTDAFYDVSPRDSSYALFNCAEPNQFAIYANVVRYGSSWDTTNEYKLSLKGKCKQIKVLEGSIDMVYSENEIDGSKYMVDGENVTYDKYVAGFKDFLENSREVILYNGSGGDQAVWEKVQPGNVMCMSYDAMIADLSKK